MVSSAEQEIIDRCSREAARLRVCLITFSSASEFGTWETKVEASRLREQIGYVRSLGLDPPLDQVNPEVVKALVDAHYAWPTHVLKNWMRYPRARSLKDFDVWGIPRFPDNWKRNGRKTARLVGE
jgi:hypothetical protein